MIIKLKNANFTDSSLPTYVPKLNGYTSDGLQNLYLFDGADPLANSIDKNAKNNSLVVTGTLSGSTKSALTGGGVRFNKNGYVASGTVDATLPFSIMLSGAIGAFSYPSTGAIIGFTDYFNYGFQVYHTNASSGNIGGVIRQVLNGAQDSAGQKSFTIGTPYAINNNLTTFCTYDGVGNMNIHVYNGDVFIGKTTTPLAINETGYTTNASATVKTLLTPCLGALSGVFATGSLDVDVFAVYTKELTASEMAVNAKKSKDIMISRGRTVI